MTGNTLRDTGLNKNDAVFAYLLLRLAIGLNILMHGVSRILAGPASFASTLTRTFQNTLLPQSAVFGFGVCLPWIEAALGLLLFVGLFSRGALAAASVLMLLLTFGSTLHQDWNVAGLQLIYSLAYAALLAWQGLDRYSLDVLLRSRKDH